MRIGKTLFMESIDQNATLNQDVSRVSNSSLSLALPSDIATTVQIRMLLALGTALTAAGASFTLLVGRQWPKLAAAIVAIILAIGVLYLMLFSSPLTLQAPVYE